VRENGTEFKVHWINQNRGGGESSEFLNAKLHTKVFDSQAKASTFFLSLAEDGSGDGEQKGVVLIGGGGSGDG